MSPEHVFTLAKAYRMYFSTDTYDFIKYRGHIKTGPLIQQRDRQFYYRLSTKLNDEQIHATLLMTHFFKPTAYITDVVTPEAVDAGIALSSRAENGITVLKHDLYEVRKRLKPRLLDEWLYAPMIDGQRSVMPTSLSEVMSRILPLDLACLLLLIPQPDKGYNWPVYWERREGKKSSLGVMPWLTRLRKADQLLNLVRPSWRQMTHKLADAFWASYRLSSLTPEQEEYQLFS
jgi:hypothetical protein